MLIVSVFMFFRLILGGVVYISAYLTGYTNVSQIYIKYFNRATRNGFFINYFLFFIRFSLFLWINRRFG